MIRLLIFLTLVCFCSSCIVTKKKYDDLLAQKIKTDADLADRNAQLEKATNELNDVQDKLNKLKSDTTNLGANLRATSGKLAELEHEHKSLMGCY